MKDESARTLLRAGVTGVVFLASVLTLMAQGTSNGTLVGLVTDTSGGVLPSVRVVATTVATNIEYPTVTNSTGNYTIPSLPIGTYRVTAELTGF